MIKVVGVVVGLVIANLIIFGWEAFAPDLAAGQFRAVNVYGICGWAVGVLIGAYVAFAISRWDFAGWIVAASIAVSGLANMLTTAQPVGMRLAAVVVPFVAAVVAFGGYRRWRASRLHLRRRP